ncbi:MAG TPA: aminocyclopropane-1-carboxylate deaminase/D-cysteine desulfhydrase family protein, partial [Microbacterium sp.]|nr:aminocyclopropane-1-carboxylate deaminase/D-cysteine desulfhydrase family protein [Microbacterium sp.]
MALADFPRHPLTFGPSPVHPVNRLSDHLGGARIWMKREDDNSGLAFGGNKTRKLEYLVPDALEKGADTLVSIGGVQSTQCSCTSTAFMPRCAATAATWRVWFDCTPPMETSVSAPFSRASG